MQFQNRERGDAFIKSVVLLLIKGVEVSGAESYSARQKRLRVARRSLLEVMRSERMAKFEACRDGAS